MLITVVLTLMQAYTHWLDKAPTHFVFILLMGVVLIADKVFESN
ncbi:hypothetical protein [Vibrio harveyi]